MVFRRVAPAGASSCAPLLLYAICPGYIYSGGKVTAGRRTCYPSLNSRLRVIYMQVVSFRFYCRGAHTFGGAPRCLVYSGAQVFALCVRQWPESERKQRNGGPITLKWLRFYFCPFRDLVRETWILWKGENYGGLTLLHQLLLLVISYFTATNYLAFRN